MALNFAPYQSSPPESERARSPPPRSATASPVKSIHKNLPPVRNLASIADTSDPWAAARAQHIPSHDYAASSIRAGYQDDDGGEGDYGRLSYDDDAVERRDGRIGEDGYTDLEPGPPPYRYNDYVGRQALQGGGVTVGQRGRGREVEDGIGDGDGGGDRGFGMSGGSVFETSIGLPLWAAAALAYVFVPPLGGFLLLGLERKSDYVRFHAWQSSLLFSALGMVHIIFSWSSFLSWVLFIVDMVLVGWLTWGAIANADTLDRLEVPFFGRLASSFVDDD